MTFDAHDFGTIVDQQKAKKGRYKYQCNFCGKVVCSLSRLKRHLGGISGPCLEVPEEVKEEMGSEVMAKRFGKSQKDVGELDHPNLPLKRCKTEEQDVFEVEIKLKCPEFQGSGLGDSSLIETQKCIGRFFYETGVGFDLIKSPSFERMINSIVGLKSTMKIPTCHELKGWILRDAVKEMEQYTSEIKSVWATTGCSILLDAWEDSKGRKLVNILVYCPRGTIYLQSYDVSAIDGDVNAMVAFVETAIKKVGIDNVVQIITDSTSTFMGRVQKRLHDKHKTLFWSVSASHCIELMLKKFAAMNETKNILDKAKSITRFVYSHESVLKLARNFCSGDLTKPSKIKSIVPFLTLENMVMEKKNLQRMFLSSGWKTSVYASTREGISVANLVADRMFWNEALTVVKATIPLVNILKLINGTNEPEIGYIYDTIDQVKETIESEFQKKESQYIKFWEVIDEIWNKYLHSPIHAAGYFLNPSRFYSSDFSNDTEVSNGLRCCIVFMEKDHGVQDLIMSQIEEYDKAKGAFDLVSGRAQLKNSHPAFWWSKYGGECPELQRFAIRILSQTCNGASKFNLRRTLAEALLTKGRNQIEQERLRDLVFVHYNMQLRNFKPDETNDLSDEEIDPMDDWIVERQYSTIESSSKDSSAREVVVCKIET